MPFLEETLSISQAYRSKSMDMYSVDTHETRNGYGYRTQRHPAPILHVDLVFQNRPETELIDVLHDLFHRASGNLEGFRFKNPVDYTTNAYNQTPTFSDQECTDLGSGVWQMWRWYGTFGQAGATRRRITKPVSGTTVVGIRNPNTSPGEEKQITQGWTVDTTNGRITFTENIKSVSNITAAAQSVATVGPSHNYVVGEGVYFQGISGMTEMNGLRGVIQATGATTITVDIDSTSFTAFSSASPLGTVRKQPQTGETVLAGCEFDIPMMFETPENEQVYTSRNLDGLILGSSIRLKELLNP